MIDEIRLKEVSAEESELRKLKILLEKVGADIEITSPDTVSGKYRVKINFDTAVVRRKTKREAGRKKIKTELYYTIAEVKEKVKKEGLETVLKDLGISESTYFRRMRYYKNNNIKDTELFD